MERNEIRQRITQIKNVADQAMEACRASGEVPEPLKDSIDAFDAELDHTMQTLQQTSDDAELEQCIDDLEEAADHVKKEAQRASGISEQARDMMLRAHDEVAELKHQVH